MSFDEADALRKLARRKTVLEIGSYLGYSTIEMAKVGAHVWAVDWHQGDPLAGSGDTLASYWENLKKAGVRDRVVTLVGDVSQVLPGINAQFDFIFIDGDHRYEGARRDIELCSRLLAPGGSMALHDYGRELQPGFAGTGFAVTRAAHEMLGKPSYVVDTLAVYAGNGEPRTKAT